MTISLPEDDWTTLLDALSDHCDELAAELRGHRGVGDHQKYFDKVQRVREALLAAIVAAPTDEATR